MRSSMANLLKEGLTADAAYKTNAGANTIQVEMLVPLYRVFEQ